MYKVVLGVLGKGTERSCAEECVSDVFFSVWQHCNTYDERKGSFKNWLVTVARYKAIDCRRALFRGGFSSLGPEPDTRGCSCSVEETVVLGENREEILEAIQGMGEVNREILLRRYFLDEDIESIASRLGVHRSYVDNRLSRGRKALRQKLAHLHKGVMT